MLPYVFLLLVFSAGVASPFILRRASGWQHWAVAGLLPPLGWLAIVLWLEYGLPFRGGGAFIWPVVLVFYVAPSAGLALLGAACGHALKQKLRDGNQPRIPL